MISFAFDSNVLIYAELERSSAKGQVAARLVERGAGRAIVAAQVLGEVLTVVRRRLPRAFAEAKAQVESYREVFDIVPTDDDLIVRAAGFTQRYQFQFWDALIWLASSSGGATVLLTEDLQDGFSANGMRALNPFTFADWPTLAGELQIPL